MEVAQSAKPRVVVRPRTAPSQCATGAAAAASGTSKAEREMPPPTVLAEAAPAAERLDGREAWPQEPAVRSGSGLGRNIPVQRPRASESGRGKPPPPPAAEGASAPEAELEPGNAKRNHPFPHRQRKFIDPA